MLSVALPPASVRVPNQWLLRQSRLSIHNKSDNEAKPGAAYRSPDLYPTPEENPGKPQLGDHLMKVVRPVTASNQILDLQMASVGLRRKQEEGKKKRMGKLTSEGYAF